MTSVPALKVNFGKIEDNMAQGLIGKGGTVPGTTWGNGAQFTGLGLKSNSASAKDIAGFFSKYCETTPYYLSMNSMRWIFWKIIFPNEL